MSQSPKWCFWVSMDVSPDREQEFHEIYDEEHVPALLKVEGVRAVRRMTVEPGHAIIGGKTVALPTSPRARHHTIYDLDSPDVLLGDAWRHAVDAGRWPTIVRPNLSNREHLLLRVNQR